jgi:hypothetical protein
VMDPRTHFQQPHPGGRIGTLWYAGQHLDGDRDGNRDSILLRTVTSELNDEYERTLTRKNLRKQERFPIHARIFSDFRIRKLSSISSFNQLLQSPYWGISTPFNSFADSKSK